MALSLGKTFSEYINNVYQMSENDYYNQIYQRAEKKICEIIIVGLGAEKLEIEISNAHLQEPEEKYEEIQKKFFDNVLEIPEAILENR